MTTRHLNHDRRGHPRVDAAPLAVSLRPRGRLLAVAAEALDFNRHGIAIATDKPLGKDGKVYLSLRCGELRVDHLVGVVHNCVRMGGRYRSGIRFRPASDLQRDRQEVEALLAGLERALRDDRRASA